MKYRIISQSSDSQRAEIVTEDKYGFPVTRHVHREGDGNWHWRQGEKPHEVHEIYERNQEER